MKFILNLLFCEKLRPLERFGMSTWVYDIIVQEVRSSLDIASLTEKQCKIYFTDG